MIKVRMVGCPDTRAHPAFAQDKPLGLACSSLSFSEPVVTGEQALAPSEHDLGVMLLPRAP